MDTQTSLWPAPLLIWYCIVAGAMLPEPTKSLPPDHRCCSTQKTAMATCCFGSRMASWRATRVCLPPLMISPLTTRMVLAPTFSTCTSGTEAWSFSRTFRFPAVVASSSVVHSPGACLPANRIGKTSRFLCLRGGSTVRAARIALTSGTCPPLAAILSGAADLPSCARPTAPAASSIAAATRQNIQPTGNRDMASLLIEGVPWADSLRPCLLDAGAAGGSPEKRRRPPAGVFAEGRWLSSHMAVRWPCEATTEHGPRKPGFATALSIDSPRPFRYL